VRLGGLAHALFYFEDTMVFTFEIVSHYASLKVIVSVMVTSAVSCCSGLMFFAIQAGRRQLETPGTRLDYLSRICTKTF